MNKSQKSIYTAGSGIALTLINGLLGLIVTKLIISSYGSDFNGLNSTVNQFINMLLIVEGGFTLATNVSLFKPLAEKNYKLINGIMAATKKNFIKIGIIFLSIGFIMSIIYSMVVKSELPQEIAFWTFLMTVISTAFNLMYATKYQILIQTEQREYVLNIIKIGMIMLSQLLIIAIIFLKGHMLLIRFITMIGAIISSFFIGYVCRKKYKYLDFNVKPNYAEIKGGKDVFVQKFTSMVYNSVPIIFISITVGTMYVSVYAIYNNIFTLLKSVIYSFINAPSMGFGKLIAEKEKKYVLKMFLQYEFIVNNVVLCILSTASVLIMPFISIYTKGISDIQYKNLILALLLIGITFFEIIHIPSGNIINMSGNFKVGKKIQTIASIVLVIGMIIGNIIFGFYGILVAVLITAILLAILEIGYIHNKYFKKVNIDFLKLLIPHTFIVIILTYVESMLLPIIEGYVQFLLAGLIILIINGSLLFLFNLIINRRITMEVLNRVKEIINNK